MDLICEDRPSDSPYADRIWHSHSDRGSPFISMAERHWGMVVTKHRGRTTLTVRGPETRATFAYCPGDAEFLGVHFKAGAFMPHLPAIDLMDRQDMTLPNATGHSFWMHGSAWQFPDYENVDTFLDRLVREGLLVFDPVVESALREQPVEASARTVQRRFVRATGLTHTGIFQIERARKAAALLQRGASILDTIDQAGYFDQPHLCRALKRYTGLTPAQLSNRDRPERLSFLYNTAP
jgi:AraC-like DNA-binding protein